MAKEIKRYLILVGVFLVVFAVGFYIATTVKAYDRNIYVTSDGAFRNWYSKGTKVLHEFHDDQFAVRFYEDSEVEAVRRDMVFWVRDDSAGFFGGDDRVVSTMVDDALYIYGAVYGEGIQAAKMISETFEQYPITYCGKRFDDNNLLLFVIKMNKSDGLYSHPQLVFVDENNQVVSGERQRNDSEVSNLMNRILLEMEESGFRKVEDSDALTGGSKADPSQYAKIVQDVNYCVIKKGGNQYVLQQCTNFVRVDFGEDMAYVVKGTRVSTLKTKDREQKIYTTVYQLEYNDVLRDLYDYELQKMTMQ